MANIVHEYFKCQLKGLTVFVQINPVTLTGLELLLHPDGKIVKTPRKFDEDIYDDLEADGFQEASALEFNLYLKGLAHGDFTV